jgi:hypothetical protein
VEWLTKVLIPSSLSKSPSASTGECDKGGDIGQEEDDWQLVFTVLVLRDLSQQVEVPEDLRNQAEKPILWMLAFSR